MTANAAAWPVEWWRPQSPRRTSRTATTQAVGAAPFWALVALTVVMILAPQDAVTALAPLRIALVAALCAVSALVFDRMKRGEALLAFGPEMRTCLLLVAWAVVTVPFSMWPGGSVSLLLDLYLKSVIVFWLLGSILRGTDRLRQIAWMLSLIAVPLALTGVAHLIGGTVYSSGGETRIVGYEGGLTQNPNDLALMLNLILPLTVALTLTERALRHRVALAAIVVCEAAGIVATFSRSGFVTLGAIGVLLLWRVGRRPGSRWLWAGLAAAVLAVPLLPGAYLERLSTIADKESDPTGSSQTRWADQLVAIGHVIDHPIVGAGIGSDVLVLNERRGATWTRVHDVYLEYAVDLGLPGAAIFVLLISQCLRAVNTVRRRCLGVRDATMLLAISEGVGISLLGFAVAALFHPVAYHVYFYYMAGLAVAVKAAGRAELGAVSGTSVLRLPA